MEEAGVGVHPNNYGEASFVFESRNYEMSNRTLLESMLNVIQCFSSALAAHYVPELFQEMCRDGHSVWSPV